MPRLDSVTEHYARSALAGLLTPTVIMTPLLVAPLQGRCSYTVKSSGELRRIEYLARSEPMYSDDKAHNVRYRISDGQFDRLMASAARTRVHPLCLVRPARLDPNGVRDEGASPTFRGPAAGVPCVDR